MNDLTGKHHHQYGFFIGAAMHYYQFNIGDYSSHTSRLSNIEDLAYRRLLDLYYLNERPFNGCSTDVAREIGLSDHQVEVDYILSKFFTKTDDEWCNKRCDDELEVYHNKQKSASKAGKASAKARRAKASEQTSNDRPTTVQPNNNQEPVTTNQEPDKNKGAFFLPSEVSESVWADFEQHRKEIRKPLKPLSKIKSANILKNLSHEQQRICVDKSISSGWAGLFPDKHAVKKSKGDAAMDAWLNEGDTIEGECNHVE